jgi:hypothetical protein
MLVATVEPVTIEAFPSSVPIHQTQAYNERALKNGLYALSSIPSRIFEYLSMSFECKQRFRTLSEQPNHDLMGIFNFLPSNLSAFKFLPQNMIA